MCIKYRKSKIVRIVVLLADIRRRYMWCLKIEYTFECTYTDIRRLTTGISSEKCVVRRFRRCANVIQCSLNNNQLMHSQFNIY